ncbi:thioesterase II family protein [Frankia sp. AgB32]|uniref:thioesterase II family protein n=1 Tax=Frankia sp. AgB32 TaxID=631119 RepID=UPI00200F636C|nr:alpha/beta fold hydrolase [Frankia sp. AgB32]MCK9896187.1 alpha/beta fold hydrolase [Frankia sp. AgB32]
MTGAPPGRAGAVNARDGQTTSDHAFPPWDLLWFRRFTPSATARARLVCFPHAGGSASFYQPVAAVLGPLADVWAVQYPGRQDRRTEPGLTSIDALADAVVARLRRPASGPPVAFLGHSMGAVVAHEVARRLVRLGEPGPAVLFVSGRRAPSIRREEPVHEGTDEDLLRALAALSGTDRRILDDEELQRMILPAVRSDYLAIGRHRHLPGPPVPCPVVALTGDRDPHATVEDMRAWADHTTGGFELHVFPGGHFYLVDRAREVLSVIANRISHLLPGGASGAVQNDERVDPGS